MGDSKQVTLIKQSLNKLLDDACGREKASSTLIECLEAKRSYYDAFRKNTVTEPDFKTRLDAAAMILSYLDGKPVERREIIERKFDTMESLRERLIKSPALVASMEGLLAELKPNGRDTVDLPASPIDAATP